MRRLPLAIGALGLAALLMTPSTTYAQQSINFSIGGFVAKGEDTRGDIPGGDVLVNNLDFLWFDINDFNGVTVGAEYLVGLNEYLDAGLGIGYYKQTVHSVYADFVNDNGYEIPQDLKLRIVPFTATIRFLPAGRRGPVQPYIGAGVGVLNWRYTETGDWIDSNDDIYHDSFTGSGTATGPVILGGARFPMGAVDIGGEVRWQKGRGDLPISENFSADSINLGGLTWAGTINVRF